MGQIIKSLASVCLSVCLWSLLRSHFLFDFDKILHQKVRTLSLGSQNAMTSSPILSKFFTLVMHFQWEGNRRFQARGPIVALYGSHDATRGLLYTHSLKIPQPLFCPTKHKNGDQREYILAERLTQNISAVMRLRDIGMVSKQQQ